MKIVKIIPPVSDNPFDIPMMDTSAISRKWLDIDYTPDNPHPARKLDIYLPETGDGPFPTIVCIHGGAFVGGSKRDEQIAGFVDCVSEGYAVASVEQRLCRVLEDGSYDSDGLFPYPLFDFKAAIRFLRANAAKYKLDPARFATAGDSAGGYHAIMAAATANIPAMYDNSLGFEDVDDSVQAVVDWFGCGDIVLQAKFNASFPTMTMPDGTEFPRVVFEDVFLGLECAKHPNLVHFASVEPWITSAMPPVLLQHGDADAVVTVESSRSVARKITEMGGHVTLDILSGYAHGDPRFYSDENLARVHAWLKEHL